MRGRMCGKKKRSDIPFSVVDFDAEVKVHDFALELKWGHVGAAARAGIRRMGHARAGWRWWARKGCGEESRSEATLCRGGRPRVTESDSHTGREVDSDRTCSHAAASLNARRRLRTAREDFPGSRAWSASERERERQTDAVVGLCGDVTRWPAHAEARQRLLGNTAHDLDTRDRPCTTV